MQTGAAPSNRARPLTPAVNNLVSAGLLAPNNRNSAQPARLPPSFAWTCSMNHNYTPEQKAVGSVQREDDNT